VSHTCGFAPYGARRTCVGRDVLLSEETHDEPSPTIKMGSFSRGLYCGVCVVESHGTSVWSVNGICFSASATRTLRA
jgi:hypothetical protein